MTAPSVGRIAVLIICLCCVVGAGVAVAQTTHGEPELSVYLPENEVVPGSEVELTIQIENDAHVSSGQALEEVTTARAVRASVTDDGPFDVRTGQQSVGTIPDGATKTATFRFVVPDDVDEGGHDVDVRIRYAVTNRVTSQSTQRLTRSTTETVRVRVVDEARFEITDVETDVQPGTTGEAAITVENVGSQTARDTRGSFTGGESVVLDGGTAEAYLGELEPGDEQTITVDAAVDGVVAGGVKPIDAVFEYRDEDGRDRESRRSTGTIDTHGSQSFAIEDLEDTLSVGYDGVIRGTVRNQGPREITDGVLVFEPVSDSLSVDEGRFALPTLEVDEATDFSFPTDVSGQADPGPRQVRFSVEYANEGRSTATIGPISRRVVVDERRGEFTVEGVDATVSAGGATTLLLTITNERPETLSNIDARLYTDGPLSTSSDRAFVESLDPGESGELVFDLSAARGAMAKTYPVELDFQYDNERGDSQLSRTYQQPISVTETDDSGVPSIISVGVVVALLAALGGGLYWWRRH